MSRTDLSGDKSARMATEFLEWKPPSMIEQLPILRDSDLRFANSLESKLLSKWQVDNSLVELPNFRVDTRSTTHLIRRFESLDIFTEIEGVGGDYVATVYADNRFERIVASGRSATRPDAVVNAVFDYLDEYLPRIKKPSGKF